MKLRAGEFSLALLAVFMFASMLTATAFSASVQTRAAQPEAGVVVPENLTVTSILLKAYQGQVVVNNSLAVQGLLTQQGGQPLTSRNVTVTWGSNSQLVTTNAFTGWFSLFVSFPPGFPAGPTNITAQYEPNHADVGLYAPTEASLQIIVSNVATMLNATVSPTSLRTGDVATVNGKLSSVNGPLQGRVVGIDLDGVPIGKATTDSEGLFTSTFQVPGTVTTGNHQLAISFNATQEVYAPASMTLTVQVTSTTPPITTTTTQPQTSTLQHTTQQTTQPTSPGFEAIIGVITANQFFPVFAIALAATAIASAFVLLRARNKPVTKQPELQLVGPTIEQPKHVSEQKLAPTILEEQKVVAELKAPESRADWSPTRVVAKVEDEPNEPAKIGMAYGLAQDLVKQRLGEAPRKNETDREYCHRIIGKAPRLEGPLTKLMELYESVQYAPRTTGMDRSVEASALLLEILHLTKNGQRSGNR